MSLNTNSNTDGPPAVFVQGADVYVAGNEKLPASYTVAKTWKNGVATNLTSGPNNGITYSVFVFVSDVYVAGWENNGTKDVAKLWKNGTATLLTTGANNAYATSVFVK